MVAVAMWAVGVAVALSPLVALAHLHAGPVGATEQATERATRQGVCRAGGAPVRHAGRGDQAALGDHAGVPANRHERRRVGGVIRWSRPAGRDRTAVDAPIHSRRDIIDGIRYVAHCDCGEVWHRAADVADRRA
jgi:hypothetical protein